jgi:ABC-type multidrug transport system ATPase subunit
MLDFKIIASKITKKFRRNTILNDISFSFNAPTSVGITGENGKGKSTLMKIISGYLTPTSGTIEYSFDNKKIETEDIFQSISFAAPYLDLIENMTLIESIDFHLLHKSSNLNTKELIDLAYLQEHQNKLVGSFSSGMKQRLKLALALSSKTPLILLDEPTSNLDQKAKSWFQTTFQSFCQDKMVFIASNSIQEELSLCQNVIAL